MPVPNSTDIGAKFCPSCGRQFAMGYDEDRCPDDGNLLIVPATDPLIGKTVLERFAIQAVIGAGGWGLVYKAKHIGLNKDVALKVLHVHLVEGRDNVMRFRREAEAASRLTHGNIVFVSDYGLLEDGRPYMAMEYLQGLSLSDMIERRGALKWQQVLPIFIEACEGVAYAHRKGFLHRDLKPSNVFVAEVEGKQHVKLLDFGLAKLVKDNQVNVESLTQTGTAIGTPAYMSPEQCRGLPLDRRSDIYSFGYLMYEVLSGTKAFGGSGLYEVMHAHTTAVPPSFTSLNRGLDVPPALEAVVMRALAKDPEDRFASAEEMIEALQKIASIDTKPAARLRSSTSYERLPDDTETVKRNTVVSVVLLVMLIGGIGFSVVQAYLHPRHDKPPVTAATTSATASVSDQSPGTTAATTGGVPVSTTTGSAAVTGPDTATSTTTSSAAKPPSTGVKPEAKPEVKMTAAEAEHLKTQVKLLEERLKIQQKQITEATSATPRVVIQQVAVAPPPVQAPAPPQTTAVPPKLVVQQYAGSGRTGAPTTTSNRNIPEAYKALPPDLASHLRPEDPPIQTVRRCEEWLQNNGYNYAVENLLRQMLMSIDKNRAMFYVNDMLKHNVMDDYQLQLLGGWRMQNDPAAAIGELYMNAEAPYKHYKYLRAGCLLRGGQIFKMQGKGDEAKRCFYVIATSTDPELQRYRDLATDMLKGML